MKTKVMFMLLTVFFILGGNIFNTLAGSWLDTCKMRLVYWKSDDVAMSNALIEVKRIEDSIK